MVSPGQTVTPPLEVTPAGKRYNYFLEVAFDGGIVLSGIIQTVVFASTNNDGDGITICWWGVEVPTAGVDYQAYNQNATLLPIPPQGYFDLSTEEDLMSF